MTMIPTNQAWVKASLDANKSLTLNQAVMLGIKKHWNMYSAVFNLNTAITEEGQGVVDVVDVLVLRN